MMNERRHHPRTRADESYGVACTSADFVVTGKANNLALRILDVGAGGACITTTGRLREGVAIIIAISVPGDPVRHQSKAIVRWSTTIESKGRTAHVAGLQFERVIVALGPRAPVVPTAVATGEATPEPRRKHKRFVPEQADAVCLPRGLLRALGFSSNIALRITNLCMGGIRIVSGKPLKPGRRVTLTLEFKHPMATVTAEGEVRWCRRDTISLEPHWDVGIAFTTMDDESERKLKLVEQHFLK